MEKLSSNTNLIGEDESDEIIDKFIETRDIELLSKLKI